MKSKKTPNFFALIIVIIVGAALYKQIDFETLEVEKPALAIVYVVTLVATIYFMIRDFKNGAEK